MQASSLSLAHHNWAWYLVPMNASATGLTTMLALYMLQLGGTVREVAISAFLSGLAVMFGSILWGKFMDIMQWRRTTLLISSASVAIFAASVYFINSLSLLILISVLVAFFTAGAGPVTNLLIMKRSRKEELTKTFSWT